MEIAQIIEALHPGALKDKKIQLRDEGQGVYVHSWSEKDLGARLSVDEILRKVEEVRVKLDAEAVKIKRKKAYPSVADQLDMMYHDKVDGTTTWVDAIAAVKAANPTG